MCEKQSGLATLIVVSIAMIVANQHRCAAQSDPEQEFQAHCMYPRDCDVDTPQSLTLSWWAGDGAIFHDIYFGRDANAVAEASPETRGVYQGRLACNQSRFDADLQVWRVCDSSRFDPGPLDWNTPYFWRIDEVNEVNPASPVKGEVWRFTTADFLVIDDFERYTDERGERLYEFWIDGWITGNGSVVGYTETPFYAGYILCHSGLQAMPFNYDNSVPPHYSEAYRAWETPQDWTVGGGTDLSLWVYGWPLPFLEKPNGKIILNGEGVWTTRSEGFLYARKELAGEGSIVARVESLEDTDAWARAGLMIRDTAFWSTKFASVAMTPAHDVAFACSVKSNQDRQETALLNVQPPCWLKLTRTGRTFTAQHSLDGATWQEIRDANGNAVAVEIDMSATVQVGLFVASNKYGVPARAEFSGVAVEGDVSGSWQPEGINARLWRNDPDSLYVAIEDAAGRLATVVHPDPNAVNVAGWTQWRIPLSDFAAAGVDLQIVARMYLGLGDRDNPQPSGAGMIHIDDIAVIKR